MNSIELIESYFSHPLLKDFVINYESLLAAKHSNTYFTYWGINFKGDTVHSVKFYAHFFEDMTADEIQQFIPTADDYLKYAAHKSTGHQVSMTNSGIALELKFYLTSGEPRTGFFFHLNNTTAEIESIDINAAIPKDIREKCVAQGVNFEYENTETILKRYYYFNLPEVKDFFKGQFGMPLFEDADILEYSMSDDISKINMYGHAVNDIPTKIDAFTDEQKKLVKYFNEKYGFINLGYGVYVDSDVRSAYFFDAEPNSNQTNETDRDTGTSVKTLRTLLHE